MASEQAKQLAVSLAALRNETNTPGQIAEFASLIDDAYECTCTERDELKAALRECAIAIKEIFAAKSYLFSKEVIEGEVITEDDLQRRSMAMISGYKAVFVAEALLNPIDYAAEKRADKAREMKEAMREANKEAADE